MKECVPCRSRECLKQGQALDRERLGGCPCRLLENEMKRGWIVLLAALFIALGAIVWAFLPAIFVLVKFAMEPAGRGCDEGLVTDRGATNSRGDVVEEYIKACTGFGTVVDYSIVLQLRGDEKTTNWSNTIGSITNIQSFVGSMMTRSASILEKSIPYGQRCTKLARSASPTPTPRRTPAGGRIINRLRKTERGSDDAHDGIWK